MSHCIVGLTENIRHLVKLQAKTTIAKRRLARSGSMVSCSLLVFETVVSDTASEPFTFGTAPKPRSLS